MSNLQVQSESKLQTFYFLFFHIFSIQKRPSIITIGSLTPIFCVEKKSTSFGTGGITWLDGELQGYIRLVGEKSSHSQPNQAALQRENHLLLEELILGSGSNQGGWVQTFTKKPPVVSVVSCTWSFGWCLFFFLLFFFGGVERRDGNLDDLIKI